MNVPIADLEPLVRRNAIGYRCATPDPAQALLFGNGAMGGSVHTPDDSLYLLIGRGDIWNGANQMGAIAAIRIRGSAGLFTKAKIIRQECNLYEANIRIQADDLTFTITCLRGRDVIVVDVEGPQRFVVPPLGGIRSEPPSAVGGSACGSPELNPGFPWRSNSGGRPLRFNGGPYRLDKDARSWDGGYGWQNMREIYWPLLAAGHPEFLMEFFQLYSDTAPFVRAQTKTLFGVDGLCFREGFSLWGCDLTPGGGCTHYHFAGNLECCLLMEWYYRATRRSCATDCTRS